MKRNYKYLRRDKKFMMDGDYIPDPKNLYNNSLKQFIKQHPSGATFEEMAEALDITKQGVNELFRRLLVKVRDSEFKQLYEDMLRKEEEDFCRIY